MRAWTRPAPVDGSLTLFLYRLRGNPPLDVDRRQVPGSAVPAMQVEPAFYPLEDRHAGFRVRIETQAVEQVGKGRMNAPQ